MGFLLHYTLLSDIITTVNTIGIKGRKLMKMNKALFLILALTICLTLVACGKSEAVTAAEELIVAIGEVTYQSGEAIQKAEEAVAALSDKEKESVAMLDQLTEARNQYEEISILKNVEELIKGIGFVDPYSEDAITAAREAYDALEDNQKEKVSNYNVLQKAERIYSDLGVVSASNGQKFAISTRLGEKVFDYCDTQIPLGLGLPELTFEEMDQLIESEDYSAIKEEIRTLADAVCYVKRAGFIMDPSTTMHRFHDLEYIDYGNLHYVTNIRGNYSAPAVEIMRLRTAQCTAMSTLFNYLLWGDYPEFGYLHIKFSDNDGHAMIYLQGHDGKYYLVNPVQYVAGSHTWLEFYSSEKACTDTLDELMQSLIDSHNPGKPKVRIRSLYTQSWDGVWCVIADDGGPPENRNSPWAFPKGSNATYWAGLNPNFQYMDTKHPTSQEYVIGLPPYESE